MSGDADLAVDDGGDSAGTAALPAAPVPLRKNRNFRLLWTGQVLSDLGSQFGTLAYPLLILALTGSPLLAGAVGTIASLAAFVVRLPAGAFADRVDRRRTMVVCDGVRALALAGLAAGVALHAVSWPVVLVVAVIDRVGDTFFTPASTAALPGILDSSQLEQAWAATEGRQYAASLGGPALGGLLFSLGRAVPFVGDAVSYGASLLTSAGMRGNFRAKASAERKGLWREAFDGIRFVWHDSLIRAVVVQAPLINFAFNGMIFTVVVALRHHGVSPTVIGLTQAGVMAGGLLGAIAAPKMQGRLSLSALLALLTGGGALCFVVAALVVPSPLVALPIALPLFLSPTGNAALIAVMLRRTPPELQARVTNSLMQVATALAALAPLVSGALVAHVSSHWAMGAFAAALSVSAVLSVSLKGLREAEAAARAPEPGDASGGPDEGEADVGALLSSEALS